MLKNTGYITSFWYTRKIFLIDRNLTSTGWVGGNRFLHDWWHRKLVQYFGWASWQLITEIIKIMIFFYLVIPFFRTYPMGIMQEGRKASMLKMLITALYNWKIKRKSPNDQLWEEC